MPQTGFAPLDWFLALLDVWGHLIVIGFTIVENLFVIGSFIPGETVVMAAGFVSAGGHLNPWVVGISSMVGTLTGSNISYWFGRRGGRAALIKLGGKFFDPEHIVAAEEYFEQHGNKTVLISRFAAGFKNFVPVIAGVSHMRVWIFELYTFIGALMYTTLMIMLGRIFAGNFDRAITIARDISWAGLFVFLVMVGAVLWARHRYIQRKVDLLAEQAARDAEADEARASVSDGGDGHGHDVP